MVQDDNGQLVKLPNAERNIFLIDFGLADEVQINENGSL